MSLTVIPLTLDEANTYVALMHRHHQPVVGCRFCLGVVDAESVLRGVCIVGRPVARSSGRPRDVAEVTRLATDGTPNACSKLYTAAARSCRAMGYRKIQTYTLPVEGGASLRASGWTLDGTVTGRQWKHTTDPKPRRHDPLGDKLRWVLVLNDRPPVEPDFVQLNRVTDGVQGALL